MIITIIAATIASAFICYTTAYNKGLRKHNWCAMGILFGPFAIPFVFIVKPSAETN